MNGHRHATLMTLPVMTLPVMTLPLMTLPLMTLPVMTLPLMIIFVEKRLLLMVCGLAWALLPVHHHARLGVQSRGATVAPKQQQRS